MTIEIERVIREHRINVGNASCSCGKLFTIGISISMIHAEHAMHVAERLAPLMKPAAANRTLIDAAKAYRDAIDARHEDEHGKPHCAIQCNGVERIVRSRDRERLAVPRRPNRHRGSGNLISARLRAQRDRRDC